MCTYDGANNVKELFTCLFSIEDFMCNSKYKSYLKDAVFKSVKRVTDHNGDCVIRLFHIYVYTYIKSAIMALLPTLNSYIVADSLIFLS